MGILFILLYIIVLGILSHVIGEMLPRAWFDPKARPYSSFRWEKDGRIYEKIQVRKWKDRVPDMSKLVRKMVRKSVALNSSAADILRLTQETCVAELVHWILTLFAAIGCLSCKTVLQYIIMIVYGLSNLPFIIIQRYNRPKLIGIWERLKIREERKRTCES